MGIIGNLFSMLFGSGRNVLKETAEVFRPNAEN
ncbi:MAG: carboxylesterase, partial [Paracoccaceae bacterium]|nr:carboxylesterase [Paracoccaceae bacterium]